MWPAARRKIFWLVFVYCPYTHKKKMAHNHTFTHNHPHIHSVSWLFQAWKRSFGQHWPSPTDAHHTTLAMINMQSTSRSRYGKAKNRAKQLYRLAIQTQLNNRTKKFDVKSKSNKENQLREATKHIWQKKPNQQRATQHSQQRTGNPSFFTGGSLSSIRIFDLGGNVLIIMIYRSQFYMVPCILYRYIILVATHF